MITAVVVMGHNGIPYPRITPQKVSDNHNIYNISSQILIEIL